MSIIVLNEEGNVGEPTLSKLSSYDYPKEKGMNLNLKE